MLVKWVDGKANVAADVVEHEHVQKAICDDSYKFVQNMRSFRVASQDLPVFSSFLNTCCDAEWERLKFMLRLVAFSVLTV